MPVVQDVLEANNADGHGLDYGAFAARFREMTEDRRLVPLDTVGLPLPGPDFLEHAHALGPVAVVGKGRHAFVPEDCLPVKYLLWNALYTRPFSMPVRVKGRPVNAEFLSGGFWGLDEYGPRTDFMDPATGDAMKCPVMVLGKHPGYQELQSGYNFVGKSSEDLKRAMRELGVTDDDIGPWYLTNLVKHNSLDPSNNNLAASWIRNCLPLLHIEIRLLRPKYMLCLGNEAAKAILGPGHNVGSMLGRVVEVDFPCHRQGETPDIHTVKVMAVVHPAYVFRKPEAYGELRDGVAQFLHLTKGHDVGREETDLDHVCYYSERALARKVDEIVAAYDGSPQPIAIDGEWHGKFPTDPGSYLRTIQFSHKAKAGYTVVLYDEEGKPCFDGGMEGAARQLGRLLKSTKGREVRLGGQFLRADLPWLLAKMGLDLRDEMRVPDDPAETATRGGWDTGYMAHSVHEALESFKLESLAARFCRVPPYNIRLQEWKASYCKAHNLKDAELEGYGPCPDDVLLGEPLSGRHGGEFEEVPVRASYSCYDADAAIRLFFKFNGDGESLGELDCDRFGNSGRVAFWTSMRAWLPFLEMEMTGVSINRTRGDELTAVFMEARDILTARFCRRIRWRGFNPNSANQCREFLFGTEFNGTVDKTTGGNVRLRPDWVSKQAGSRPVCPRLEAFQPVALRLTPIKAAGAKGKTWERVVADRETHVFNPSTDKESLGILGYKNKLVAELRDLRFLSQVLKGVLRKPKSSDDGVYIEDEDGNWEYDGGLLYWSSSDGEGGWRVRSHFYPVETGRCSSSRPNIQNISKRRDADHARILGQWKKDKATGELVAKGDYLRTLGAPKYQKPIRSMIRATPGYVLVEADYKSAELAAIAWLAGCRRMIEDVNRNLLDEDDPNYLDLHSQTAVRAFKLVDADGRVLAPNKRALESVFKVHLRTGAKAVNFSVPYGSSAGAIARKCREEGTEVSDEEAQALINGYYELYPENKDFLDEAVARVSNPGFLCGSLGRYRRFPRTDDESVLADMQRQARNFPIQNVVADAISLAMYELHEYRRAHRAKGGREDFRMVLQIHDALLFECRPEHVEWLCEVAIPECMERRVEIWPKRLDGTPRPEVTEPYHFMTDREVYLEWGVKMTAEEAREWRVPERYVH